MSAEFFDLTEGEEQLYSALELRYMQLFNKKLAEALTE